MINKPIHVCPVCRSTRNYVLTLPYKTFRHLDFDEFRLSGRNIICECSDCGAVFRSFGSSGENTGDDLPEITNLYTSENYARHQEEHMVREKDCDTVSSLSEVQAKIITASLPTKSNIKGILDIGCFNGKLLAALKKRLKAERFLGMDVAPRPGFPFDLGIEFSQEPMDELTGTYDLILLSQSIMYFPDLENLFKNISRLLGERGVVFIQVPDLSLRPCSVLLGDQYHYFSRVSIKSMLQHFNFGCTFCSNTPFPRDILLFAGLQKNDGRNIYGNLNQDKKHLNDVKSYLDLMVNNIKQAMVNSKITAIFGTTIDASFAFHLIPEKILYFVDENPKKVGTFFLGKEVRHPKSLNENDVVILPMGKTGDAIRERFSKQYPGVYVCA